MPNHVQNILTIKGHKNHVEPMLESLKTDDSKFSFDKIIPMPEELKGTRAPAKIVTQAEYDKWHYEKNFKEDPHPMISDKGPITKKMSDDWTERFGADNWYDWAYINWGSKWGAYDIQIDEPFHCGNDIIEVDVRFQTAWTSGRQAVSNLAEQYPTIDFYLIYADEDCGYNTGKFRWKEGFTQESDVPEYSMENYLECWGGEDDWECVDGEWQMKEDED